MRTLRVAVIGTGRIAVQHLACLARIPTAQVVAVCDLSPTRAQAAAARWAVPRWYDDHRRLLDEQAPDIVHVTTPPASHATVAFAALGAGAHVIVEKPAAVDVIDVERLLAAASAADRHLVESHTYVFSEQVQRLLALGRHGDLGEIVHVDASINLGILEPGSPFVDPHVRHPAHDMPGGPVADFLTHLASLARTFAGPHRSVATVWRTRNWSPTAMAGEMRALIDGRDATASVSFSADARPIGFWVRVEATRLHAVANLFETRLTIERVRACPRALASTINGLGASRDTAISAVGSLVRKIDGGPGSYEGLWTLIERTYEALAEGREMPVSPNEIRDVNRLVADLTREASRL